MEIAEVALDGIQGQDILFAPFEQSVFVRPILDCSVKDFCHEHCHGILEHAFPDACKAVLQGNVPGCVEA